MDMITLSIKDRKYGMRKMPPIKGAAFGIRVANLIAKVLSDDNAADALRSLQSRFMGKNPQEQEENKVLDEGQVLTVGQIIVKLLANVSPADIEVIFKEAFSWEVYCGSKRLSYEVNFEEHFTEFPGDLYVVAIWATYNHVKDFFTGLGDGMKALMTNSESKMPKQ